MSATPLIGAAPLDIEPYPQWLQKWWTAVRPFSLPASTMSVLYGTVLAATIGGGTLKWGLFFASLIGMAILHSGANLLNDVYDFRKGVDRRVNPVSGAVVRGWISPKQALISAWVFILAGFSIGLYLLVQVGMPLLWIGTVGIAVGVFYTWGPFPLKFHALGDMAVFLNFGILGALGSWTVQTGSLSWIPVLWAVPMSLLVVGILHANNWRDIQNDAFLGITTIARLIGDRRSECYYSALLISPYILICIAILTTRLTGLMPKMPMTFLLTFLTLPMALKLIEKGKKRRVNPQDFLALDGATGRLNLAFGMLCTAALALDALIGSIFG